MNYLDVILVLVFLAVFAAGFFSGLSRAMAGMIALVLGVMAGGVFYRPMASLIDRVVPGDVRPWMSELWGFLIALAIVMTAALILLTHSFRVVPIRTRRVLETRGGFPAIFGLAVLSAVLGLAVVAVGTQLLDVTVRQLPAGGVAYELEEQVEGSHLADFALRLSPSVYDLVAWATPGEPAPILRPTVSADN